VFYQEIVFLIMMKHRGLSWDVISKVFDTDGAMCLYLIRTKIQINAFKHAFKNQLNIKSQIQR